MAFGDAAETLETLSYEVIADFCLAITLNLHDVRGFSNGNAKVVKIFSKLGFRVDKLRCKDLRAFFSEFVGVLVAAMKQVRPERFSVTIVVFEFVNKSKELGLIWQRFL